MTSQNKNLYTIYKQSRVKNFMSNLMIKPSNKITQISNKKTLTTIHTNMIY